MVKKSKDQWQISLGLSQVVILIGVITSCLTISFYLGYFSGKKVGGELAMDSALSTLPKVPITSEKTDPASLDKTEDAVSDVYSRLKKNGAANKGDSITELQMPAIEAIKESDAGATGDPHTALSDSLEAVETPTVKDKKPANQIDPWEIPSHAAQAPTEQKPIGDKKSLDQILDESDPSKTAGSAPVGTIAAVNNPAVANAAPTHAPTMMPATVAPTATMVIKVTPTATAAPKITATPKPTATPTPKITPTPIVKEKKVEKVEVSQGVTKKGWYAQVAAPKSKQDADAMSFKLRNNGFMTAIESANVNGDTYFRILVGPEDTRSQAERLVDQLKRESYISGAPFIRNMK